MGSIISFAQKHTQPLVCGSNRSIAGIDKAREGSRSEFFRRAAEKLLKQEAKAAETYIQGCRTIPEPIEEVLLSMGMTCPGSVLLIQILLPHNN
jgi:hypothetical protein